MRPFLLGGAVFLVIIVVGCVEQTDRVGTGPNSKLQSDLEDVYRNLGRARQGTDAEAVIALSDFKAEARRQLRETTKDDRITRQTIHQRALALENAVRKQFAERVLSPTQPFLSCCLTQYTGTSRYNDHTVALIQETTRPDGQTETEHVIFSESADGWRYMATVAID